MAAASNAVVHGVFISYRREDSQELAGRLFDRLAQRFGKGRVFRDIDTIAPGANFAEVIGERVGGCDALVALIGKKWLEATDGEGRRKLDRPGDFVKEEISAALKQGKLVIPALIEGTQMPSREALSAELAPLADRNALLISDARFDFDVGLLISAIEKTVSRGDVASWSKAMPRRGIIAAVVLAFIVGGTAPWWGKAVLHGSISVTQPPTGAHPPPITPSRKDSSQPPIAQQTSKDTSSASTPESLSRTEYSLPGDAVLQFRVVSIRGRDITIEVDYRFNAQHGDKVMVGGSLKGVSSGFVPTFVPSSRAGTAQLQMSVSEAGTSTDIDIFLYEWRRPAESFARRTFRWQMRFQ